MTEQEQALASLASALAELGVPYMVMGGLANAVWGEPRATLDIDVTVWAEGQDGGEIAQALAPDFASRVDDPEAFIAETRVLPVLWKDGVPVDVLFGMLPFEQEAIERAVDVAVGDTTVRFCTPEDLILLKIVSDRDRDLSDARAITLRRFQRLDLAYLEPRIEELASLLERPGISARWMDWKSSAADTS